MQYGLADDELHKLITLFAKHSKIDRVILYGSRAKGNFRTGSDVDITLVGENLDKATLNSLELQIDDLLLVYQFDISIFHQLANSDLVEHIERVGKIIYERKGEQK